MRIWVDADACPKVIKDILYRAATGRKIKTVFVANQYLMLPKSPFLEMIKVGAGFDVADSHIAESVEPGDLVVTADIPLAALIVEAGALGLNPRGELYTENNIKQRLSIRNQNEMLRSAGEMTGGPAIISQADRRKFANELDRTITRQLQN